jgi:hypothetical protein
MVFMAGGLGDWLIGVLADAGRRRVTRLILGSDQEQALRKAAADAIHLTATGLRPDDAEEAGRVEAVLSQVFDSETSAESLPKGATLLEGLQSGIASQLAVLDDSSITGTGSSAAEVLGIDVGLIAENLTGHLLQQIMVRGAEGGPLFPLATLLGQNVTQLDSRQLKASVGEMAREISQLRAMLGADRGKPPAEPSKVYVLYTLTLQGQFEFDANVWANAFSDERQRMVEEAVGEKLDDDFNTYGGLGIAECIDGGQLEFTSATDAEVRAEWDAEVIESASRAYAGIGDYDEWPSGVPRPSAAESFAVTRDGVDYVVLRNRDGIMAVYDVDGGAFNRLNTWPREIETR